MEKEPKSARAGRSGYTIPDYYVTCPKCGKLHQRCRTTDALIVCSRCGYQYRVLVKDGMMLSMSAEAEKSDDFLSLVRQLAYERDRPKSTGINRQPQLAAAH